MNKTQSPRGWTCVNGGKLAVLCLLPFVAGVQSQNEILLHQPALKTRPALFNCSSASSARSFRLTFSPELGYFPLQKNAVPSQKRKLSSRRLIASSAAMITVNWIAYHRLNDAWWSEPRTGFHFYRGYHRTRGYFDLAPSDSYFYHLDKAGHFFSATFMTESLLTLYNWVGFSESRSRTIAAALTSVLLLEIEIYDGFFQEWGFSVGDFAANELGVAWALAQQKSSTLRSIRFKGSYDPLAELEDDSWLKNYGAMTFWVTFPIKQWLSPWPAWLDVAIGYGSDRLRHGDLEAYLSLDLNPYAIIPDDLVVLRPLRSFLTYMHLPFPALQFRPKVKILPYHF